VVVKVTEREVSGWLNEQVNEILKQGGYSFECSTIESGLSGKTSRFPDIAIWMNRQAKEAFAFIEIKSPGKEEDTDRIPEVANRLNVKYAITWNFWEAILFYINNSLNQRKVYPTYVISSLEEWLQEDKKIELKKCLRNFLDDLKELYEKGHTHKFEPDKYFFIKLLQDTTESLHGWFKVHLAYAMQNRKTKSEIDAFLVEQGIPELSTPEVHNMLANQWVYGVVTKILFYLTIRRHFSSLPDIIAETQNARSVDNVLKKAFNEARKLDWQAVFEEESPIEKIGVPESCRDVLSSLLQKLDEYDFGNLREDVIGEIFENLIPQLRRRQLGQYFTREDLVDFIIGFVVQSPKGYYMDPTCGSGTFLNRLYSRIKWLSNYKSNHNELLSQIWGVDIAKFPAELATINLFRQDIKNYRNFPRIKVADFLDVFPGQEFEFPPPKATPGRFDKQIVKIPEFSGLLGNFPFIRQEQIEKKKKGNKEKITKRIASDWFVEYPHIFRTKKETNKLGTEDFKKNLNDLIRNKWVELDLSGQADIYAFLFLHAAKFTTEDGRMGFITSNSYLDTRYGYVLKKFFLDHFKIVAVVCSWAEPWFDFASINTVFTVLERCEDEKHRLEHNVKFVKVKKKLEELIPFRDLHLQESDRWGHINGLVRKIEYKKTSSEDSDFRIRVVKQKDLIKELGKQKQNTKWGKYLRAPEVYFDILEKVKDLLIPLPDLRRGYTTGINDFFYLEPTGEKAKRKNMLNVRNARGWKGDIENRFLKPVIKSPKEAEKIILEPEKLKFKLFMCNLSKSDLKKKSIRGALKYIDWGEKQKTKEQVPWKKVPSVSGRKLWYDLGDREPGSILMQMINSDRYLVFLNNTKVHVDHNLFELLVEPTQEEIVAAILNSSFTALNREVISRINLGDGATKTEGVDWANNVFIFDYTKFEQKQVNKILRCFRKLLKRQVYSIEKEVKQADRQAFDKAVLEAVGLDPDKYIKEIYSGLTEIVNERLSLPKMRKKVVKAKVDVSIKEVKKQVEQDVIPDGLRNFPQSFVERSKKIEYKEISTSGSPLHIRHQFFGTYQVADENDKLIYEASSLEVATYIICAYMADEYVIPIPKNIITINKAVNSYKRYIQDVYQKLVKRAFSATQDHNMADRIANDILKENGYSGNFEL